MYCGLDMPQDMSFPDTRCCPCSRISGWVVRRIMAPNHARTDRYEGTYHCFCALGQEMTRVAAPAALHVTRNRDCYLPSMTSDMGLR